MTRRRLFLSATGSVVSLSAVALLIRRRRAQGPPLIAHDPRKVISSLRKRLHFLHLDEAGLNAFARELQSRSPDWQKERSRIGNWGAEHWTVGQFLMSTDFFLHGADEDRIVKYLAYYDPYELPCSNPFASR